jgi:hypothetical protein
LCFVASALSHCALFVRRFKAGQVAISRYDGMAEAQEA